MLRSRSVFYQLRLQFQYKNRLSTIKKFYNTPPSSLKKSFFFSFCLFNLPLINDGTKEEKSVQSGSGQNVPAPTPQYCLQINRCTSMQLIWLSPHQDRLHWLPAAVTLRPSQMRSGWGFLVCKLFDGLKEMSSLPIREQDSYSFIFLFVSDLSVTMFVSFFMVDADMPFHVSLIKLVQKCLMSILII